MAHHDEVEFGEGLVVVLRREVQVCLYVVSSDFLPDL